MVEMVKIFVVTEENFGDPRPFSHYMNMVVPWPLL